MRSCKHVTKQKLSFESMVYKMMI